MYPVIHIAIPSYALMAATGGFLVMIFIYSRIGKYGLPFMDFIKMFVTSIIFGFFGSRVVYIISRLTWLLTNFSFNNLLTSIIGGGLVFYGGLLGVLLGIYIYCKKYNINHKKIYNMIAPSVPLFHAFGRIGCFMSGCCYGVALKTPLILFGSIRFERIPTQLIEAIFEMFLFVVIFILQKKHKDKDFLKIYMITYAIFRFFIEFLRGDDVRGFFFGISTSQVISLGICIFYIILSIRREKKQIPHS